MGPHGRHVKYVRWKRSNGWLMLANGKAVCSYPGCSIGHRPCDQYGAPVLGRSFLGMCGFCRVAVCLVHLKWNIWTPEQRGLDICLMCAEESNPEFVGD